MKRDGEQIEEVVGVEVEPERDTSASSGIGELMAASQREFEATAPGAARATTNDGAAGDDARGSRAARSGAPARLGRVDLVLRLVLAGNVVVVAMMLALAGPVAVVPPASPGDAAATEDPFVLPPRKIGSLPTSPLWERAVQLAGSGEYAQAAQALEQYLQATPEMHDVEKHLVYNQIAYYLIRDGRFAESQRYSEMSRQVISQAYLPGDLLSSAAAAERAGDAGAMRAAHARFLLQLQQATPAQRQREAEALLGLADSFRLSAQQPPAEAPR